MKTIALIDHHKGGHHLAFIKLFSKYLLQLGHRLYIYFPEEEQAILRYLEEEGADLTRVKFFQIKLRRKKVKFLGRLNYVSSTLILWIQTRRILNDCERTYGIKIDLVFFAWLDDHIVNDIHHQLIDWIFPYKWSGLFFHPWYLYDDNVTSRVTFTSRDSILKSKNCTSVAIHDEFVQEKLNERIKKKVVVFPEVADSSKPQLDYYLEKELKQRANGRIIISLIGISKRKGFTYLIDLIFEANPKKFFFFFSGDITSHDFNEDESAKVKYFLFKKLPDNCFYYPHALEEGSEINAIINATHILFFGLS